MPTPNGRLHLGHIAGPFLRLDVMSRYLRSRGHQVRVVTGTDPYESHVVMQAEREGRSPRELASGYTAGIRRDLAALDIDCELVDPLTSPGREPYERHTRGVVRRLLRAGVARVRRRRYPVAAGTGSFLPRAYLTGRCPRCDRGVAGCVCEACGHQFFASDMVGPQIRPANASSAGTRGLEWREVATAAVELPPGDVRLGVIEEKIDATGLPSRYLDIARRYVRETGMTMELSLPAEWGVPWAGVDPVPEVLFNYATPYAWTHVLGELAGSPSSGEHVRPFARGSEVVTIGSFGRDITACWVAGTIGLAHLDVLAEPEPRPFDYYWGNEFLLLQGDKFSTSRRHVIWGGELVDATPVTSDMARYHLATIDPALAAADFRVEDLVATVNQVVLGCVYAAADAGLQALRADRPDAPTPSQARAIGELLDEQSACFPLDGARLDRAAALMTTWIDRGKRWPRESTNDVYWWLKALALISVPVMPNFARRLWSRLGEVVEPCLDGLERRTVPLPGPFAGPTGRLYASDLNPCLPSTVRETPVAVLRGPRGEERVDHV